MSRAVTRPVTPLPVMTASSPTVPTRVRIGSRNSPMAHAQVDRVQAHLTEQHPELVVSVVAMATSGDRWHGSCADLGGKGAFTKEVDQALLDGQVDLVVHCVKTSPGIGRSQRGR
jgi:hydroxymethylbilane synthase